MKNVLYFEPDQDKTQQIDFLAKLAGLTIRMARSQDEVLNWLRFGHLLSTRFDLLLIGSAEALPADSQLFSELMASPDLQVVVTGDPVDIPDQLRGRVTVCETMSLIKCLANDSSPGR